MTTTKIEVLPGALELTPAERAWDTYDYLIKHPEGWNQSNYGAYKAGGLEGCFAHHLVARAGFTITAAHPNYPFTPWHIPASEAAEAIKQERLVGACAMNESCSVNGFYTVAVLAQHLLDYKVGAACPCCSEPSLFCPLNSMSILHSKLVKLFSPPPVAV